MEYRLLGPNINQTWGGMPEEVAGVWKPPIALILDHNLAWSWLKEASPRTVTIGRIYHEQEPDFNDPNMNPTAVAQAFVARDMPTIARTNYSLWQGTNETIVNTQGAMARYAEFEAERTRILYERYNIRAIVGSFAVGNPTDMSLWNAFIPALEAAKQYGGALGLHEYNWPSMQGDELHDPAWLCLRHRKVYDGEPSHGWAGLPKHLRLPLYITEGGLDGSIDEPYKPKGWRGHASLPEYASQLEWYDKELLKDPYVVGCAIYVYGNLAPEWTGYDIRPDLSKFIVERARPLYRRPRPVPEGRWARGIDVSVYQGKIRWKKVADDGITFAFIRASAGLYKDRWYDRNVRVAPKYGILTGSYHFQTADDDPMDQARFFRAISKPYRLGRYADLETYRGVGPSEEDADTFLRFSTAEGIYTSKYMWDSALGYGPWPQEYRAWLADYKNANQGNPRKPRGCKKWEFQQTTSRGQVGGIIGNVDLDIFNGTVGELRQKYGGIQ